MTKPPYRIGFGWDSHEFVAGVPLKIGGVTIAYNKVGAPDIGTLFPPSDPRWKGADSTVFLEEALNRVKAAGYAIGNVDSSLVLLAPKIGPHAGNIRGHVAKLLGIVVDCVGLKAKTPEGMGTDHAAIANVVVLLERATAPKKAAPAKKLKS